MRKASDVADKAAPEGAGSRPWEVPKQAAYVMGKIAWRRSYKAGYN